MAQLKIVQWLKPREGQWKLNSDGASRGNPGPSGGGGVLRNSEGKMLLCFIFWRRFPFFSRVASSPSRNSYQQEDGTNPSCCGARFEIVDLLNNREPPPWKSSYWWDEVLSFCDTYRPMVIHTYREGNQAADSLANHGIDTSSNSIFTRVQDLPRLAKGHIRLDKEGLPHIREGRTWWKGSNHIFTIVLP